MKQTFDEFLAAREALLRNLTDEGARACWTSEGSQPPRLHVENPRRRAGERRPCTAQGARMSYRGLSAPYPSATTGLPT